jgi:hypothetical protein
MNKNIRYIDYSEIDVNDGKWVELSSAVKLTGTTSHKIVQMKNKGIVPVCRVPNAVYLLYYLPSIARSDYRKNSVFTLSEMMAIGVPKPLVKRMAKGSKRFSRQEVIIILQETVKSEALTFAEKDRKSIIGGCKTVLKEL